MAPKIFDWKKKFLNYKSQVIILTVIKYRTHRKKKKSQAIYILVTISGNKYITTKKKPLIKYF